MKNKENITSILDKTMQWIILITAFAYPIFFIPISASIFDIPKLVFFAFMTSILMIVWVAKSIYSKTFSLTISPFTILLILYAMLFLFTGITFERATFIYRFITFLAFPTFATIFFLIGSSLPQQLRFGNKLINAFIASTLTLAFFTFLEAMSFGPSRMFAGFLQIDPAESTYFLTPSGSIVGMIGMMVASLVLALGLGLRKTKMQLKIPYMIASVVTVAALMVSVFTILPGKDNSPNYLGFQTSWNIAVENIKSPRNLVFGVGPDKYLAAFSQLRGAEFNLTDKWAFRYGVARNYPLHIFTTLGLAGLLIWIGIFAQIGLLVKRKIRLTPLLGFCIISLLIVFSMQMFVAPHNLMWFITIILMIIVTQEMKTVKNEAPELVLNFFAAKLVEAHNLHKEIKKAKKRDVFPALIGVPLVILAFIMMYGSFRVLAADILFGQSLTFAAVNNGTQTYESQRKAVSMNPYNPSYHQAYASTNFALANSLSQKEDLTEAERQNVTVFVRQAIREARYATVLNPFDATNWELLASLYQQLINVAENAEQFAVQSYMNAIQTDPFNPLLRVDLGGLLLQLEQLNDAIRVLEQAVSLKPDLANARYNLAYAYLQAEAYPEAAAQYEILLQILEPGSSDYEQVLEEYTQLREQLGEEVPEIPTQNSENLTVPEPLPTPSAETQIDLSEDEAPPSPSTSLNSDSEGQEFNSLEALDESNE